MRSALILIALSTTAQADGIADVLMAPYTDPCLEIMQTRPQFEAMVRSGPKGGLYDAYLSLWQWNCGAIPNPYDVAWYVPGDDRYHWAVPPLLPQTPSPVPLDGSARYLIAAMAVMALGGRKWLDTPLKK